MSRETGQGPLVAGSILVIAGASIAGLYSFEGRVSVVFVGFCLFVLGYLLARDGWAILSPLDHLVRDADVPLRTDHPLVRGTVGLVGIYGIAMGVTQFSLTVVEPNLMGAVKAGVYSVGGYVWTHVVIHQRLF